MVSAYILLNNPVKPGLKSLEINSLVDTGALHLCIPEHVAIQLELNELEKREVIPPFSGTDGSKKLCSYVGPIKVQFQNRSCYTGALVLGDSVLLGAIPMEDMDLIVQPAILKVTVNPANPNYPTSTVK